MSSHRFEDNLDDAAQSVKPAAAPLPDGERLSEQEVQDVLAQWNAEAVRQEAASTQPSLAAVADTLGIPEAEARRLLTTVRRRREAASTARRKRLAGAATFAAGVLAVCGYAFNNDLAQTNRQQGTFVVQSVQVRPAVPADNIFAYPLDKNVTRMDVRLHYNPPSLWHFLVGPNWQPAPMSPYLVTQAGQRLVTFAAPGGQAGITQGWLRHTGMHEYTEGFAFPAAALRNGGATLWFTAAADDDDRQQALVTPVQPTE